MHVENMGIGEREPKWRVEVRGGGGERVGASKGSHQPSRKKFKCASFC